MDTKDLEKLKVGDFVCDCRYRHQRIAEIGFEYFPKDSYRPVRDWFCDHLPDWLLSPALIALEWIWPKQLWDAHLVLESGSHHSYRNCCNPVDHQPFEGVVCLEASNDL